MNYCLVVPCFNEERRLLVDSFQQFVRDQPEVSLHFVNDGSSDGTLDVIKSMARQHENISFLSLDRNCGKSEAIRQGLLSLDLSLFDFVGYWDADLATPLTEVELFRQAAQTQQYDVIMGSRILRLGGHIKRKWHRHMLGRLFATTASILLNLPVYDTQCGAKMFSTDIIKEVFAREFMSKWLFDVEILFRYKTLSSWQENRTFEVPLRSWQDEHGSKLKMIDFIKAPSELFRMYVKYGS